MSIAADGAPEDDAWFWTAEWRAAEAEADADVAAGRTRVFGSMAEMFAEFDAIRAGEAGHQNSPS